MAASDYTNQIQQIYLAYLGRPADPAGLAYWADQVDSQGGDLSLVLSGFAASEESAALYGEMSTNQAINAIYTNLFKRDADDAGVAYWQTQIESGAVDPAQAALAILLGAQDSDITAAGNKLTAANAFTASVAASGATGYSDADALAVGRDFLNSIDASDASLANLDTAVAAAVAQATGTDTTPTPEPTPEPEPTPVFAATLDQDGVVSFTNQGAAVTVAKQDGNFVFSSDGPYAGSVTVTGTVASITVPSGTVLNIGSADAAAIQFPGDGTVALTDNGPLTAAALTELNAATAGVLDASKVTAITEASLDQAKALLSADATSFIHADGVAVDLTDTTANAADLVTLDGATTGKISADALTAITGELTAVQGVLGAITTGTELSATSLNSVTLTDALTAGALDDVVLANHTTLTLADVANNTLTLVDQTVAAGKTLTIDASAVTSSVTIDGSAEADGILVLKGGSGDDTLNGGKGADTLTGGAGIDNFVFGPNGISTLGALDTITDYRATTGANAGAADTITLRGATVVASDKATVQDLSSATDLADALNTAANGATTDNGLSVFLFGGDTYAYVETTGSSTTYVENDTVIKLAGTPFAEGTSIAGLGIANV
ncbi:DUF4214 domain-containing protein [Pseudomonas oryzihabitans]|uniref:DUF4214 domain-containing protein n=1 Tax=Pseudomonas oryzihabitans TaxID=47885 RepID=UPI0005AA0382|nr:DUF4214 domain-containing protein [Pseudomonas oryzihabitans]NMZ45322.1 DUF4214 domain-containing protein [Pseudomonas oryzihabitans]